MNGISLQKIKNCSRKLSLIMTTITFSTLLVIFCRPLYSIMVDLLRLPQQISLSKAIIMDNYDRLMQFMFNLFQKKLTLPDFTVSTTAVEHFREVRFLFLLDLLIFLITLLPTIHYLRQLKINKKLGQLFALSKIATILVPIMAIMISIFFEPFFLIFHQVLFRNDKWLFDPIQDSIITILPEEYFASCFLLFLILTEIFWLILFVISKKSNKTMSNRKINF